MNSDIWVFVLLHIRKGFADENILRVNILRVYSLQMLLFFKIKHPIKFGNMTLVPGDTTSGEMTFGRLDRLPF